MKILQTTRPFLSDLAAVVLILALPLSLHAQTTKKPAPTKAPAAAKAPATAKAPAAQNHAAGANSATHGPTPGGVGTHGPTTSSASSAHTGPTTANSGHSPSTAGSTGGRTASTGPARTGTLAGRPNAVPGVDHGPLAHPAARGEVERSSAAGVARLRADGHAADVHNARLGMDIHHNLAGGGRRIESVRPGGVRLVSERGRPGYIGRPFAYRGHEFERRAYFDHGRSYNRYYGAYGYRGYNMHVYAPGRYYPGAYYAWAYHPWGAPVHYGWGFGGSPWYGYYGAYFTPYPVYATPSLWLTDYLLSQTLAAAYQAQLGAGGDGGSAQAAYSGPAVPPEAKQMIADEVQNDIALENAQAGTNQQQGVADMRQSSVARLMEDGKPHAFLAGQEVDVVDASGLECAITAGDVVQLSAAPGAQDTTANVTMIASKGGKDCARGAQVAVGIDDLQEMDNYLREHFDAGLQELATQQGKHGLPAAPAAALAAPTDTVVAQAAPPPETDGAQQLAQQEAQATAAENEVLSSAAAPGANPPASGNDDLFKPQN